MDYAAKLAKVKAKIRAKGRQIMLSKIYSNSADVGRPWLAAGDSRDQMIAANATVYAVNIPMGAAGSLGLRSEVVELYKNTQSVYIAEPGEDSPEDFDRYQLITDGGQEFKISFIEKLKPADTTLLYYIGVAS